MPGPPPFAGDDGAADPALAAALARPTGAPGALPEVRRALAAAPRVLVAVVARPATDSSGDGSGHGAGMHLVGLVAPDGVRALPVFSSVATLAAWDPSARPVPVTPAQAALSAVAEGATLLLLDPGGAAAGVGGPLLRRLAEGDPLLPLYDDPGVRDELAVQLAAEPVVRGAWLLPARDLDAQLALLLDDGAPADAVAAALDRIGSGLRELPALRAATVDGLDVVAVPDGLPAAPLLARR